MNPFSKIVNLIYPNLCIACWEEIPVKANSFCVNCLASLPFTSHFEKEDLILAQKFWGKVEIEHLASLFYFRKESLVQEMMHNLKYAGKNRIGTELGKLAGQKMQGTDFEKVDAIIPVPIHYKKRQKRGYNQSLLFAQGITDILDIPILTKVLIKEQNTKSQTDKGREHRYQNVLNSFAVRQKESIKGKHILIVDDVITTGATLEACARKIQDAADVKSSIVTMAMAIN